MKITSMFGGGMARQGYVCGAVVGGLMALGLRYGYTQPQDKQATYDVATQFLQRFQAHNGAVNCRDLLGVDLSNPEESQRARDAGTFTRVCPQAIRSAVAIISDLLEEERSPDE